jgi:myo-inositol-1(or 4)-monophosphatase
MSLQSAVINVMEKAAIKAGRALIRDFKEVEHLQTSRKGPADFVSTANLKAEEIIKEELSFARPQFGFLLKEGGEIAPTDGTARWLIDPLNGTTNFLHGIPYFCVVIALEQNGELTAAVIYNPITDDTYWAEKGRGAFLNDTKLIVSGRKKLEDTILATGIPSKGRPNHRPFLHSLMSIMPEVAGIRHFGSAALDLCYVAQGRFDGFFETDLQQWDIAAGILLVREAGGEVTTYSAKDDILAKGEILATNKNIHGSVTRLLSQAKRVEASAQNK